MTTKRFTYTKPNEDYYEMADNQENIGYLFNTNEICVQAIVDLLNTQNETIYQLKKELFEVKKDYIIETYADNPIRRDERLKELEKELEE